MIFRALLLILAALLSGCIIFDKKSEAVVFHQFAAPSAVPPTPGMQVFVPRAIIPSALRRPNVVLIDNQGWAHVEDAHRWIAPLDRAIPETMGRHLNALGGVRTTNQTPSEDHLVLLLTVDKMEIVAPDAPEPSIFSLPGSTAKPGSASFQITCRLEKSDGTLVGVKTLSESRPLKDSTPVSFVQAQSANVAAASAQLAKWLQLTSSSK